MVDVPPSGRPSATPDEALRPSSAEDQARSAAARTGDRDPYPPPSAPPASPSAGPAGTSSLPFGLPGRPVSRSSPFYLGFMGAVGVFLAWGLVHALVQLSQVLTLLLVALFLALGLDPAITALTRRGLPRAAAVAVVFVGLLAVLATFVAAVAPLVVAQAGELAGRAPDYVQQVREQRWFQRWDSQYHVVDRIGAELQKRLTSGATVSAVFGGVLGAGRAVLSGFFSTFTVLVLTLYFLASLHSLSETAYRLVPASRRPRVRLLGDEIFRRIGGYVMGQTAVAAMNGLFSYLVMLAIGVPYPAVLAPVVAVFGLVPLVGASIGAAIAIIVALFSSPTDAIVLGVYYVVYQQVENYLIAPRIMSRTVEVPGAVTVVAALAGGTLLGVVGALIAIPLAAGVLLVVREVLIPRQQRL